MSLDATMTVLDRTMRDESFLDAFRTDPDTVLADYDLTAEETTALRSGNERALRDHLDELALSVAVAVLIITLP